MKRFLPALALAFFATQALAGEKEDTGGQNIAVSPVALPIVVDGKVVNYVFVTVRLDLAPLTNSVKLREKEPYIRDALVRAAHRDPFTLRSDLTKIDEVKLKAFLMRESNTIIGPGVVRGVVIVSQA
ncbi:MAG TPA: hypothetical protein VFN88_04155, partial [Caulobacteraceae bacterium]|nr:hypothetical protein [Caulobacteraceae bacterium]